MDTYEIKQRINERIDSDDDFARRMGEAIEDGLWEVVAKLVAQAIGYAVSKVKDFVEWVKDNW